MKPPFKLLPIFTHTASIEVNPVEGGEKSHENEWDGEDLAETDTVTVYIDINETKPNGEDYELSSPYVIVGKGKKVPAFLTPLEESNLEERAYLHLTEPK